MNNIEINADELEQSLQETIAELPALSQPEAMPIVVSEALPVPAIEAPALNAHVCPACSFKGLQSFLQKDGVDFEACPHCGSLFALNPKPVIQPETQEYLFMKYTMGLIESIAPGPYLLYYAQDNRFVDFLNKKDYPFDGYDPRFSKSKPTKQYELVVLLNGLNFGLDALADACSYSSKYVLILNNLRYNRNADSILGQTDLQPALGHNTLLSREGLHSAFTTLGFSYTDEFSTEAVLYQHSTLA